MFSVAPAADLLAVCADRKLLGGFGTGARRKWVASNLSERNRKDEQLVIITPSIGQSDVTSNIEELIHAFPDSPKNQGGDPVQCLRAAEVWPSSVLKRPHPLSVRISGPDFATLSKFDFGVAYSEVPAKRLKA